MPANLPPQYLKADEEYRRATKPQERLEKLRELLRLLPKHKGTEKLQSDLKQKISQLKDEQERGSTRSQEDRAFPPRATRGGRPGHADRTTERGEEHVVGGTFQCSTRNRSLSVHDARAATRNHDVARRTRAAGRHAASLG